MAKEILLISGKGGTGKTSFTASFASIAKNLIICDLDVDAPDLHLILQQKKLEQYEFWSGSEAFIKNSKCSDCGTCIETCHFDAINKINGQYIVNSINCEGCKFCVELCPSKAIDFRKKQSGMWYVSQTNFGKLVHANLLPAEENSGKLVSLLRYKAKELIKDEDCNYILCDGPPGIGCPVISSVTGVDIAVILTEPTPSGIHDLDRIIDLCNHFKIPAACIINKCDINLHKNSEIKNLCYKKRVKIVGEIPFNKAFVKAVVLGKSVVELNLADVIANKLQVIWTSITSLI